MKYITGIHALNLPCNLNTTGDWHASGIQWNNPKISDTSSSIFGDWGIELEHFVPLQRNKWPVANHLRACLDMLNDGDFSNLQGMREDYICTEEYTPVIFNKVLLLRQLPIWSKIFEFMKNEYKMEWINFWKENKNATY